MSPDRFENDVEHRLRAALASRANRVEAHAMDVSDLEHRATAARRSLQRRRVILSVAAVVAVVAAFVAGFAIAGDDDDRTNVATEGDGTPTTTTAPSTTTTSTTVAAPTDDDRHGWPGNVARVFDDPDAAALAFVTEVLRFADPALEHTTTEGNDAVAVYHPRPTASVSTTISVHNTGTARGWVVTGVTSDQGTIDPTVTFDGETVRFSGSATAFEATVATLVLDVEGNVLARDLTMAGANGEQGPYEAEISVDPAAGTPFWLMIAEGDASGEGEFIWATTFTLENL